MSIKKTYQEKEDLTILNIVDFGWIHIVIMRSHYLLTICSRLILAVNGSIDIPSMGRLPPTTSANRAQALFLENYVNFLAGQFFNTI